MGLFQHRPEDPTEWAGLPSEPLDDETVAERLPESAPVDAGLTSLFGGGLFGGGAATSVEVPLTETEDPTTSPPPQSPA